MLPELAVVRKEARNNWYSPYSYVPAKLLVETPLLVIPPLIFLAIMGNMSGLTSCQGGGVAGARFFMCYLAILTLTLTLLLPLPLPLTLTLTLTTTQTLTLTRTRTTTRTTTRTRTRTPSLPLPRTPTPALTPSLRLPRRDHLPV